MEEKSKPPHANPAYGALKSFRAYESGPPADENGAVRALEILGPNVLTSVSYMGHAGPASNFRGS